MKIKDLTFKEMMCGFGGAIAGCMMMGILLLTSCQTQPTTPNKVSGTIPYTNAYNNSKNFTVIKFDSCEYLTYMMGTNVGLLTHKGNCKYCAARAKK